MSLEIVKESTCGPGWGYENGIIGIQIQPGHRQFSCNSDLRRMRTRCAADHGSMIAVVEQQVGASCLSIDDFG